MTGKATTAPASGRPVTGADNRLPVAVPSDGARGLVGFTEELQRRVSALLLAAVVGAAFGPARRASRVDPVVSLRTE